MKRHLCVHIVNCIKELDKGINIFNAPETIVRTELQKAILEGKTYYSGCDNMDKDGRCAGHED